MPAQKPDSKYFVLVRERRTGIKKCVIFDIAMDRIAANLAAQRYCKDNNCVYLKLLNLYYK